MEQTMKANRNFRETKELQGGIATWVLMLFGLSVIMYMFGMHSIWDSYATGATVKTDDSGGSEGVTGNTIVESGGVLGWFSNPLNLITAAGAGLAGVIGVLAIVFRASGSVCAYIFIIGMLTIILNLFVFPVSQIQANAQPLDASGIPFTIMLLAFFNLFYVLTIFEVISGRPT
jgi:hypothetical protein